MTADETFSADLLSDEDMEDEEDAVVREIDVFLSPALGPQLHLMQFPLHHDNVPLPNAARIKPRHGMIELDQQIPGNIEMKGAYGLNQRTYKSHTIPVSTHLALGKLRNNNKELHLVPLSFISQMRPSFSHVDEANVHMASHEDNDDDRIRSSEDAQKKPLMFQKKESERAALARKNSYAFKKSSEESEEWLPLQVHGTESPESHEAVQQVTCPTPHNHLAVDAANDNEQDKEQDDYVHTLNYLPNTDARDSEEFEDEAINAEQVSLCTLVLTLLKQGGPVPYFLLRNGVPSTIEDASLHQTLASCAVLIRGNFCLDSRLMRLPDRVAELRTLILLVLQVVGYVERRRLTRIYSNDAVVTPETILRILQQLCVESNRHWTLKLEDDADFATRFPSQVFAEYWVRQTRRLEPLLRQYQSEIVG